MFAVKNANGVLIPSTICDDPILARLRIMAGKSGGFGFTALEDIAKEWRRFDDAGNKVVEIQVLEVER